MEKSKSLFIKIDEFIFQKLDLLKAEGLFQKAQDLMTNLDESQQKLAAQLTTFLMLLLPFFIVLGFWITNSQSKKAIEVKKQIIEQIALFDGNKTTLSNVSGNYLSQNSIQGQDDLDNRIRNIASSSQIDQQKVSITNFSQTSSSASVSKIEAVIAFYGFGTSDFSNLMRGMVESERFKVEKINLTKNTKTNLLEGSVSVIHLGVNPLPAEGSE